jgi:spore germination protein YaaH
MSRRARRFAAFLLVPLSLAPLGAVAPVVGPSIAKRVHAVLGVLAPGVAQAATPLECTPAGRLKFSRSPGRTAGTLRWLLEPGVHARVLRDGRVVGQTARHALRIRVTIGHVHRFTVVALDSHGAMTRCRTTLRVNLRYLPPTAPRALAVSGDEHGLQLTWLRSRRGDGRLAGYRLLRNGVVIGQTRGTRWRLGASPNRTYRFAVVAVDRGGHRSRPSNVVTLRTGHQPPSTPAGLEALPISDSEIGARWQTSVAAAGRIAGYRVLRDGVVVKQASGTSHVLDHLAAGTTYRIAVAAVDSLGYVSRPSAAVAATTQAPVPSSGSAHAYLLASTDRSFVDFRDHYRSIGFVYPTYFDCTVDAGVSGRDDPLISRWAQARRVRVLPRINCQRTTTIHKILTDPPTRAHWIDALSALVDEHGYDGVSLDFEAGAATDRAVLSSFVADLAARLHANGKLLSIAVSPKAKDSLTHPRSGIFDYPVLSQSADYLFVLGWGLHWSTSVAGSQDDISWTATIVSYIASLPLKHKFVYGTNLYAMDWAAGGGPAHPGVPYEYDDFVSRIPALSATTQLDSVSDTWHATYTDGSGVAHDVWYPDARTVGDRILLAASRGLGGFGVWRLGREDQRVWDDPQLGPGASW